MLTLSSVSACRTSNSVVAIGPSSEITSAVTQTGRQRQSCELCRDQPGRSPQLLGQAGKGGQCRAEQTGVVAELGGDDGHVACGGREDLAVGYLSGPLDITLAQRLGDPAPDHHHRRI